MDLTPFCVATWHYRNCGGSSLVLAVRRDVNGAPIEFSIATGPTPWGTGIWGMFPVACIDSVRPLSECDSWPYSGCPSQRWTAADLLDSMTDAARAMHRGGELAAQLRAAIRSK